MNDFDVSSPQDWAQRLYQRLPAVYRIRDLEVARQRDATADGATALAAAPLFGLLRAVAEPVAAVRQNLDDLWDDFFIETCADRIVPYLGSLVGATLAARPIGQNNRLIVSRTVGWRRAAGTPATLTDVARTASGWPAETVEMFRTLIWNQHLDHVRADRSVTLALRDLGPLRSVGGAGDPAPYLLGVRTLDDLDLPRANPGTAGPVWAPPGGRNVDDLAMVVSPLRTFPITGSVPVLGEVGSTYHLDPLGRDVALYHSATATPITRADTLTALGEAVAAGDVMIRQYGVPLLQPAGAGTPGTPDTAPFTFGDPPAATRLHGTEGMRLLEPSLFAAPAVPFRIEAVWSAGTVLGTLTSGGEYQPGDPFGDAGDLSVRISADTTGTFPATVLAVRDERRPAATRDPSGTYRNALLIWLPRLLVRAGTPVELSVAADGSTRFAGTQTLARAAEGQIWPPGPVAAPSRTPADPARGLHRAAGLRVADPTRLTGLPGVLVEAYLVRGEAPAQLLGGVPSADRPLDDATRRDYAVSPFETVWQAGTFRASLDAVLDRVDPSGLVALRVSGEPNTVPQLEVVVTDRAGGTILAYLPEIVLTAGTPEVWLLPADDGSTYAYQPPESELLAANLARAGAGQVLPIDDTYPLRRRIPVAGCPDAGEVGVDPTTGRFRLASGDPILAAPAEDRQLTADYVEAFTDRIGARPSDVPGVAATRVVSKSGDAFTDVPLWRIHTTVDEALGSATPDDVIEIADSATYPEFFDTAATRGVLLRAGPAQRPCIANDLHLTGTVTLAGLLVSGQVLGTADLTADTCTFTRDVRLDDGRVALTRSLCAGITVPGVPVSVADSIVDTVDAGAVRLDRTTVLHRLDCRTLTASNSLLAGLATVVDRQHGCVRFSRVEPGSTLPRRYRCVPAEPVPPGGDRAQPAFVSRLPVSAGFGRLGPASSPLLRTAGDIDDEVGAFAATMPAGRLSDLRARLTEYLPVGLRAHVTTRI